MVSNGWRYETIEELIARRAITGHQDGNHGSQYPRVNEFGTEGVPFLTAKLLNEGRLDIASAPRLPEEHANKLRIGFAAPGDVVLAHNATVGRVGIVPAYKGRLLLGTSLTYFRLDKSQLIPRYLAAYMSSPAFQHQLEGVMGLSTRNQVPITTQRKLRILVPPLHEQEAITHILGALEDKIELNRKMNETLEEMARALFKSWFVDLDPFRAKAAGKKPYGMDDAIASLFPDHFEASELGMMPRGSRVQTIDEVAILNPESWGAGNAPRTVAYVDLANAKRGRLETVMNYSWHDAPSRARRVLRPGDTILGTVRPGNGSYALVDREGLTGSTGFAVLRPRSEAYVAFVYLCVTAPSNIDRLAHLADGGAYPAVRPELVGATRAIVPSDEILGSFQTIVGSHLRAIAHLELESSTLAELRDTLLPKLLSGELRLENAEKLVGEAT